MSNARKLANLLGTSTTVPSSNMPSGSIIQVQHVAPTNQTNNFTDATWSDATDFSINITPKSSSSKFYITASAGCLHNNNNFIGFRIYRDNATVVQQNWSYHNRNEQWNGVLNAALSAVDEPATASQVNYKIQVFSTQNAGQFYFNYVGASGNIGGFTVMEIAG
tara:strand:+ start:1585 stop:2076 length:492 start_codon:yes stop_codon:yes gene_type:complete